jgi:hypothetical protein
MVNIGDSIRDIEDSDCYIEGTVLTITPLTYSIEKIVSCGMVDYSRNGEVTESVNWFLEVQKEGKWIQVI